MKVLHVVKTAIGASWVLHQVRVLRSLGIEVVVALPSANDGLAPRYRELGATVVEAVVDVPKRPWEMPRVLSACRDLVEKTEPDLIHLHHAGPTYIARIALGKRHAIPRIFQVAGPLHLEHELFTQLDIRTAGPPDYWIATCRWTGERYRKLGIPPERVSLSYAGTDAGSFSGVRSGCLRRELGISGEEPLAGMVAYMYAPKRFLGQTRGLKGHEDFIEALRMVREKRPEVRGVIVGGAWDKAAWYEKRIRALGTSRCNGYVTFLGTRPDVPAIYPDLDLAVVPSHSENVGGAVEALLSGVPVVASDVGGLPDLVQEGKTGFLAPARNPEALAKTMLRALDERSAAKQLALQGQTLARQLFDVERTAREVAGFYQEILSSRGQDISKLCGSLERPQ